MENLENVTEIFTWKQPGGKQLNDVVSLTMFPALISSAEQCTLIKNVLRRYNTSRSCFSSVVQVDYGVKQLVKKETIAAFTGACCQ